MSDWVRQAEDNPAGSETAEEVEPTMNTDEQAEQEEVNDAIEDEVVDDESEDSDEEPESSES